ncbi:hypothetical protein, partial [Methanoculleus chikugoensis]|uniref:hypothetical protein n=1 Tax=Methanoculleus chikugoensis TaxID=118126 RepID=UPI001FB42EBB
MEDEIDVIHAGVKVNWEGGPPAFIPPGLKTGDFPLRPPLHPPRKLNPPRCDGVMGNVGGVRPPHSVVAPP